MLVRIFSFPSIFFRIPFAFSSCSFRICFLCFILRFWNHVFTCVSLRLSAFASSTLSGVERYRWAENLFSSPNKNKKSHSISSKMLLKCHKPVSWGSLNTVRAFLLRQCFKAFKEISLAELPNKVGWNGKPMKYQYYNTKTHY